MFDMPVATSGNWLQSSSLTR